MSSRETYGTAPAEYADAVTPSDVTPLRAVSRGIYVGVAGDLTVVMAQSGNTVLFKAVSAGSLLPIRVSQVMSTGTTASSIVSVY